MCLSKDDGGFNLSKFDLRRVWFYYQNGGGSSCLKEIASGCSFWKIITGKGISNQNLCPLRLETFGTVDFNSFFQLKCSYGKQETATLLDFWKDFRDCII